MKTLSAILVFCSPLLLKTQVAITYLPFQSIVCVSSNTERLAWADFKLETNTFFTNMNVEVSPKINFKRTELINYYLGSGVSFNPVYAAADLPVLNGYFIDIGARIKPFEKYKGMQVVFEISPYVNQKILGGNLRTRLGIAYNFTRKTKN